MISVVHSQLSSRQGIYCCKQDFASCGHAWQSQHQSRRRRQSWPISFGKIQRDKGTQMLDAVGGNGTNSLRHRRVYRS